MWQSPTAQYIARNVKKRTNLTITLISQNEEAEELMRKIEKEEEQFAYEDPDKKV